ncbi:FecR family protein [Pandoraea iniqua]|uniref:FecR family protein n=1 Tax=Pandoraea iniqua TaxID=2508288 RepID=A0A5E4RTS7_9BURK|nr:FecR domain-containing protein [Pandoraea iniqua]VVD66413.1 FecR family protein [Pandoraea iniqua]
MNAHSHTIGDPLPESVTLAATEWFVRLQANEMTTSGMGGVETVAQTRARAADQAAWQRWHDAHPQHAQAWQRLVDFGSQLRTIPPVVAHGTLLRMATRKAATSQSRRRVLGLFALATVAGAAWTARDSATVQSLRADLSTGVGERRTVQLDDGTALALNTDSAVDVRYTQDTRRLRLLRGEIAVTTGADADHGHRPFFVDTAHGRLQALGTHFLVRQQNDTASVIVLEGAVRVTPSGAAGDAIVLTAGQGATFDATAIRSRFDDTSAANAAAAWTQGMLVVHAMPLGDFLAELSRYRRGHLGCAPEVANLLVSGIYPVDDTDRVLDMLARALPLEIERYTRWWVRVRPGTQTGESPGRIRTIRTFGGDRTHT